MITLAYITNRKDCRIQWWIDSLRRQAEGQLPPIIIVDFWASERDSDFIDLLPESAIHVEPKPTVWAGSHRLTKQNWFCASSVRNTALCYCQTEWLAYCDDISVLGPDWYKYALEATQRPGVVTLGAYKKLKCMSVTNGSLVSFEAFQQGVDNRLGYGNKPRFCGPEWMYGCSLVAPVEAFLTIGGWPELCDSIGGEDYCCGQALKNAGYRLYYDPRMMTFESEELHHVAECFLKHDWHFENGVAKQGGNGYDDCSHAALNIAKQSKYFDNGFGPGGIRALREHMLNGGTWPDHIGKNPQNHWYTKQPLSEM